MKKDFVLGIGCQKGGTSWLRDQLNSHDKCNFGFTKEYKVFDKLYGVSGNIAGTFGLKGNFFEKFLKKYSLIRPDKKNPNSYNRDFFLLNQKNYFDYFDSLFLNNKKLTTTGDITPSYAGLPEEAFLNIKKNLEEKNFKVKIIFIMRDPLERICSQERMIFNKYKNGLNINPIYKSKIESLGNKNRNKFLEYLYKDPKNIYRTRYENTINNIEKIFDPEDIFFSLYENLFTKDSFNRLRSFLGIYDLKLDKSKIINRSPKSTNQLSEETRQGIFDFYKSTYIFCRRKFNAHLFWNNYY